MNQTLPQINLGNSEVKVSSIALGCMGLSAFYNQTSPCTEEQALELIGEAIKQGVTFFDTAHIYMDNELLLNKAIKKYGRDKFVIASKAPFIEWGKDGSITPVPGTAENIKKFCYDSLKRLGIDKIDLYYMHRADQTIPIEIQAGAFKELIQEGKIGAYGLSEVSEDTIRRAHKIHPISAIQDEYSLFTRDIEKNGILSACKELGITLVAYSPLCRGLLTGQLKKEDIKEQDFRNTLERFKGDNYDKNMARVKQLQEIAKKLNITASQLALSWLLHQGDNIVPIPGTTKQKYLTLNNQSAFVKIPQEILKEINEICSFDAVVGSRYDATMMTMTCVNTPKLSDYKQ